MAVQVVAADGAVTVTACGAVTLTRFTPVLVAPYTKAGGLTSIGSIVTFRPNVPSKARAGADHEHVSLTGGHRHFDVSAPGYRRSRVSAVHATAANAPGDPV